MTVLSIGDGFVEVVPHGIRLFWDDALLAGIRLNRLARSARITGDLVSLDLIYLPDMRVSAEAAHALAIDLREASRDAELCLLAVEEEAWPLWAGRETA